MKTYGSRVASRVPAAAAVAALVLLAAAQAHAQGGGRQPVPPGGRPRAPAARPVQPHELPTAPSVREREFLLRGMEEEAKKPPLEEQQRLAMQQIADDYRTIQQIHNRMMAAAMKKGAVLDYGGISGVTSEVRRRALRLRENIALTKADKLDKKVTEQKDDDDAQLKKSLLLLDTYLMSFVDSAIFKNPEVYDARAAAKAGQDLAGVIALTQMINSAAEKLGQPAKPKP